MGGSLDEGWMERPLPQIPADLYGEEALRELGDKARYLRESAGLPPHLAPPPWPGPGQLPPDWPPSQPPNRRFLRRPPPRGPRALPSSPRPRPPPPPPNGPGYPSASAAGYLSDGSETSMSIHSTQSERPRRQAAPRRLPDYQAGSLDPPPEEELEYYPALNDDGTLSDSCIDRPYNPGRKFPHPARNKKKDEDRKKSLMNRLIPKNPAEGKKRLGFPRSEEVGAGSEEERAFAALAAERGILATQASTESAASSDSAWLPVVPDGPLGDFVSDLGPGQVVGRQVLASPCLGEIQLGLTEKRSGLEVEIVRARNLSVKPGARVSPAPYVKVYLMEGKTCVAKAKTNISRRTTQPLFQQALLFNEAREGRMLQVTVWGDYGRMERKVFMGIAQIRMDGLNFTQGAVIGWYKLYHSSSLVGTSSPGRKDSQEMDAEGAEANAHQTDPHTRAKTTRR